LTLSILAAAACSKSPTPPTAAPKPVVPDFAGAFKHQIAFDAAASEVQLHFSIAPGFHAYGEGETVGRPLRLEVPPDPAFKVGVLRAPKGQLKDLPIGHSVTIEGEGVLALPLQLSTKSSTAAAHPIRGMLYYQICTDTACDRPRSEPFELKRSG
jgi:hypothetical protein